MKNNNSKRIYTKTYTKAYRKTQRGAVLAFCLIFLIVLTLLAVTGMETTIMEERMAGNMQDYNVAFQAAEASLEVAEIWLSNQIFLPPMSADGTSDVWSTAGLDPDSDTDDWWEERSTAWWNSNADTATGLTGVDIQPQYILEEYYTGLKGQSINVGTGDTSNARTYHRVTARGVGGSGSSQVMLQSTYVRPYD